MTIENASRQRLPVSLAIVNANSSRSLASTPTLLDDEHVQVRLPSAIHALSIEPERGLRVLRDIAAGPPSLASHSAERTLKLWEAGTLPLQWWK